MYTLNNIGHWANTETIDSEETEQKNYKTIAALSNTDGDDTTL